MVSTERRSRPTFGLRFESDELENQLRKEAQRKDRSLTWYINHVLKNRNKRQNLNYNPALAQQEARG